jgi:hypothetical protein
MSWQTLPRFQTRPEAMPARSVACVPSGGSVERRLRRVPTAQPPASALAPATWQHHEVVRRGGHHVAGTTGW